MSSKYPVKALDVMVNELKTLIGNGALLTQLAVSVQTLFNDTKAVLDPWMQKVDSRLDSLERAERARQTLANTRPGQFAPINGITMEQMQNSGWPTPAAKALSADANAMTVKEMLAAIDTGIRGYNHGERRFSLFDISDDQLRYMLRVFKGLLEGVNARLTDKEVEALKSDRALLEQVIAGGNGDSAMFGKLTANEALTMNRKLLAGVTMYGLDAESMRSIRNMLATLRTVDDNGAELTVSKEKATLWRTALDNLFTSAGWSNPLPSEAAGLTGPFLGRRPIRRW